MEPSLGRRMEMLAAALRLAAASRSRPRHKALTLFAGIALTIFLFALVVYGVRAWWIPYEDVTYVRHAVAIVFSALFAYYAVRVRWPRVRAEAAAPRPVLPKPMSAVGYWSSFPLALMAVYAAFWYAGGNAAAAIFTQLAGVPHIQTGKIVWLQEQRGRGSSGCHDEITIESEGVRLYLCVERETHYASRRDDAVRLIGRKSRVGFKIIELDNVTARTVRATPASPALFSPRAAPNTY